MNVLVFVADPQRTDVAGADVSEVAFGGPDGATPTSAAVLRYEADPAADLGTEIAKAIAEAAQLGGRVVRVVSRESDAVAFPLVGVAEFAEMRQTSRPYASTMAQKRGFPLPEAQLASGPVWEIGDIARWIRDHPVRGR